jgi:hypothetical protein
MRNGMRIAAVIGTLALVAAAACGGGQGREREQRAASMPASEALELLKTPESPYRIIYHTPVNLARTPS